MSADEVSVVDIIPQADSGETNDNSEPSIAVNPANPLQFVAAGFGPHTHSPYFVSINGGTTWSDFGVLLDSDKSIAWVPNGSAVLTATLFNESQINLYSATQSEVTSGGDFGSTINNFVGSDDNDQPWIRISPDGQIYTAYNNDGNDSPGNGESASINVSTDGGASYQQVISLDHVGGGSQDDPAVRHAVSGTTTYAIFDRWNTRIEKDAYGERHDAQLVVDKSLIGGADDFTALGVGGNGTQVGADHINVFTRAFNTQLSVGLNRVAGGDIAIAVDPNNVNHVVVAYTDGPGFDGAGVVQLIVAESEDGGNTWSQKYTTSEAARSSQPALAILADGTIGFLYDAYDSTTNELSQHFVTTSNDFASTNDITLATETNNAFATFTENPYLGDFFDLTSLGNTFYGIFSALNFDNGDPTSGAAFTNVSFQRDFTGTPGTSNFQLTNSGRAVSESVDPFAFTLSGAGTITQLVSSGVVSSGVSVASANVLEVLSGGTASAISVGSSGTEQVDQGGNASATVISGGGIEVVYGSESGAALAGGTLEVISGGVVRGATVSSGGTLEIWSSGTAISTTVLSGGTLEYFGGAIASGTTLSAGATIEAGSGYVASGLAISSGLTLVVGAEGSAANNTVLSGGTLTILFGGTTSGSFVSGGGIESVSFLGSALGTTIGSGGSQDIASGGLASGTLVDAGGSEVVGPFGSAVDATVSNGGSLIVSSGGSLELVGNDTLSGVTLLPGAILLVGSGYTLSGYVVSSGITLGVLSGGTASNTTVQSGGAFEYFIGGANGSPVLNSGAVRIYGSGISSGGTVDASSPLEVALGGEALGASISSGGVESVLAGGSDADAHVHSRGTETVYSGGTVTNDQIDPGGLLILSAGFASGVSLDGSESVLTGGVDTGSTIDANGSATVRSGGLVMGETLSGVLSLSGGLAVSTTIESGGVENVLSGGLDSVGTISSGASEFVSSGGVTSSATIDSGGLLGLFGGTAVWTAISSGGSVIVSSGSLDSAALISVGGTEVAASGGTVSSATLSGGMLTLSSGSVAISTTIGNTAEEVVAAGGTIGFTTIDGGTLTLKSGALISGSVVFAGGGNLRFGDTAIPANLVVSGFAASDLIDLTATPFSSNGTATTSGNVLAISESGQTYNISFSTTLSGSNFALLPDDGSGTDVASGVAISSGQTVSITSGQLSTGLAVLSGGVVDVLSGGSASAIILANGALTQVSSGGTTVGTRILSSGMLTNAGGTTVGTTIHSGGIEFIFSGGHDSAADIDRGGSAIVFSGGVISGAIINSGGMVDLRAGSAISITIALGGREDIHPGGIESGAIISWGGDETVHSGGVTTRATVNSGGLLELSGGTAVSALINTGAAELVWRGGTDSGAFIASGGNMGVESGGTALGTMIDASASVNVFSGGSASGSIIAGIEVVSSGGTISDTIISLGGELDLKSGALASGGVAFLGSDTLIIHGDAASANFVIGGFDFTDTIDLADVSFDGGGTATTSGNILTITEHGNTHQFSFSTNLSGYEFMLGSDGEAGTDVSLFSVSQTVTVGSGQTSGGFSVLSGVTVDVQSGGTVGATTISSGGELLAASGAAVVSVTVLSSGTLEYFNGAFLHQINFLPGAILEIGSGNLANGLVADNGLTIQVASGGTASSAAIGSGGTEDVLSGGLDSAATITSDGVAFISSGGETSGAIVSSGGILAVSSGGTAVSATIGDGGLEGVLAGAHDSATRIVSGGTMFVYSGGIASAATISGGTMELLVGGSAGGAITFAGAAGTLQINDITMPGNTIFGFLPGDTFYLSGVPFDSGGSVDLLTGNVLQIIEGGQEYDLHLDPSQDFSGKSFHLNPVSSGGTLVTEDNTPCYCAGTRVLTDRGEVEVETLAIGDNVITANGEVRPIRWIGKRSYAGRFARSSHVLPIRIKAGALDVDQPRRDLWISPQHAMLLEGVLIEALDLINGVSIVQADRVERVDYFHIELDSHDIIIAEGALSESFVDDDSRGIFQNAHEFAALYPNAPEVRPAHYCAPRRAFGAEVESARRRIAQRAGIPYTRPATARRPRALVIDSCIPQLGHDGGANAILDHIRALQAAGFEVSFLALGDDCKDGSALSSRGVRPLSVPRSGLFSDFAHAHAGQFALIYLHRAETATRCLKLARRYFDAQIIYSVADLHHLRLRTQSQFASGHAAELMHEARDVALQELSAALSADCVVTHSVSEAEQLEQLPSIAAAGKVRVIPWVVPIAPVQTRFADRSGLAFIGSFTHAPNVDAARWLVSEIMPLVWREVPEVQCLIVGSDLSEELRGELARRGVDVLGRVGRLGDVFERIRCTVAPLRFGAGLKDKVLRSMAAGLPCVGTPEAFRGMHALPAEITSRCQGETASELAAALVRMLRDERANANSAQIGLTYIAAFYNQPRIDRLMREISHSALTHHRAKVRPNSDCKVLDFDAVPCRGETELAASSSRGDHRIIFR